MNIQENISLSPYTVYKIGGPARYFYEAQSVDDIREALLFAKNKNIPFYVLGAGSNILVADEGFNGLIIKMNLRGLKVEGAKIYAEAGASMAQVVNISVKNRLGGFEWGVGVPGTIGGSVFGNAGCYGSEMKDAVESVIILDTNKECAIKELKNKYCTFAYRDSIFKKHPEWIILETTLKLFPRAPEGSKKVVLEHTKKRLSSQDIGSKCAGCIFKNIQIDKPGLSMSISAGKLIDTAGLKGLTVGGAMVSKKHANFIINTGDATARDIKELIAIVKSKVKEFHGVELEEEVRYL